MEVNHQKHPKERCSVEKKLPQLKLKPINLETKTTYAQILLLYHQKSFSSNPTNIFSFSSVRVSKSKTTVKLL